MDWLNTKDQLTVAVRKYRFLWLLLLAGILLMVIPEPEKTTAQPDIQQTDCAPDLEEELSQMLSLVSGAGKAKVMLSIREGEETVYQTDEDRSDEDIRRDTVLVTASGREEAGLIRQITPPVYRGALVLCQGADNATVRLALVEAVMSITGLTSDCITVLKMK